MASGLKFVVDKKTIGIKGSSGTVFQGINGDICCHITLDPSHWVFRTERKLQDDPIMIAISARFGEDPPEESTPIGKNGDFRISGYEGFSVPHEVTFWSCSTSTIGWFGYTANLADLVSQFAEMGKWLNSKEAKAEFDRAYGDEPVQVKRSWAQVVVSGK